MQQKECRNYAALGVSQTPISYIMKKGDDIVCEAESTHCFMRKDGHVMRIEREMPEFSAFVSSVMQKDDSATSE